MLDDLVDTDAVAPVPVGERQREPGTPEKTEAETGAGPPQAKERGAEDLAEVGAPQGLTLDSLTRAATGQISAVESHGVRESHAKNKSTSAACLYRF